MEIKKGKSIMHQPYIHFITNYIRIHQRFTWLYRLEKEFINQYYFIFLA